MIESISLFELNEYLRRVIALNFPDSIWITAEISQINFSKGHAYIDLIEKGTRVGDIIARSKANIWRRQYQQLKYKIGTDINNILNVGSEILIKVTMNFSERWGMSLNIEDIDVSYTLGKHAQQREETIKKLGELDLLDKNKELELPLVIQNIAVISSSNAAGYQDFIVQLLNNNYGYDFDYDLFETRVQGANASKDIIEQLEFISNHSNNYDCIAIIRGGGSKLDLAAFDDFALCKSAANCHLPIIAGIGHDVDDSVLDLIVKESLKTPTAVADFIIHNNIVFESSILDFEKRISYSSSSLLHYNKEIISHSYNIIKNHAYSIVNKSENEISYSWKAITNNSFNLIGTNIKEISNYSLLIPAISKEKISFNKMMLQFLRKRLKSEVSGIVKRQINSLVQIDKMLDVLSPINTLKRGYSITKFNQKAVTNSEELNSGDHVEIFFSKGNSKAIIK